MLTACFVSGNITQVKQLEMNYANYKTSIVQAHSIQLINWLLKGGLFSPSQMADMHKLCNALNSSECKWRLLTITEVTAHADKLDACHAIGKVVGKLRKWRYDAM